MIEPGMVTGVDREYVDTGTGQRTGHVSGLLQTGEEVVATYAGDPPWPLSTCDFETLGGSEYFCRNPIGDKRTVMVDDFMFYGTSSIGDTEWTEGGAGSSGAVADPTAGAGVLRLSSGASAVQWIRKRDRAVTLADSDAWWLSAKVRTSGAVGNLVVVGLADANVVAGGAGASSDAGVYVTAAAGAATLTTVAGLSSTPLSIPEGPAVAGQWLWVDVLVVGGVWAAAWVNGSGPWVVDTTVPGVGQRSVTPFIRCLSGFDEGFVDVDCVSLARVSPVRVPDGVAIPSVPL